MIPTRYRTSTLPCIPLAEATPKAVNVAASRSRPLLKMTGMLAGPLQPEVAAIVLFQAVIVLAGKVRANVGCFGVDVATHTTDEGEAAKPKCALKYSIKSKTAMHMPIQTHMMDVPAPTEEAMVVGTSRLVPVELL